AQPTSYNNPHNKKITLKTGVILILTGKLVTQQRRPSSHHSQPSASPHRRHQQSPSSTKSIRSATTLNSFIRFKHLLWRICKGCLPTRTRLQESVQARQAAGLDLVITARLQQFQSASEVINDICCGEDRDTAGLFAECCCGLCGKTEMKRRRLTEIAQCSNSKLYLGRHLQQGNRSLYLKQCKKWSIEVSHM
ncbi:hypothetical protein A2U01_0001517, partial [Trifolium medium]|nr:hypothetical protein [Trifolium medium]